MTYECGIINYLFLILFIPDPPLPLYILELRQRSSIELRIPENVQVVRDRVRPLEPETIIQDDSHRYHSVSL